MVKNLPGVRETQFGFLGQEDPLEEKRQLTPVFLPGKSMDRGVWRATVHRFAKESDTTK